jgi:hypothetical protein
MALSTEDLDDQIKYRQIMAIPYSELVTFVWSACIIFLWMAITVRINIDGYFPVRNILFHTFLGLVFFPVMCIPVHEILHVIPYFISGARKIRIGMDLNQFIFYVTAHRYVANRLQFRIVAVIPFLIISLTLLFLIFSLTGLWKWSLSLFLFVHATMCAGDFAMLNFYWLNRRKKIYTWDDADQKMAYFYEKI